MTTSEELRTLSQQATPGPWTLYENSNGILDIELDTPGNRGYAVLHVRQRDRTEQRDRDTAYLAALSPDVVLRLLDVVDAAEKWRAELPERASWDGPPITPQQHSEAALAAAVDAFRVSPEEAT